MREFHLALDRHLRLRTGDVPPCRVGGRDVRGGDWGEICPNSIVGSGRLTARVDLPEQSPVQVTGKVTVVKGLARGRIATFYLHTFLIAPVTAEIVSQMRIERTAAGGVYGLEAITLLPKIAGGTGSVTHLGLRFSKGVFAATCPPKGSLQVQQRAEFVDGTVFQAASLRNCKTTQPRSQV
jgi:hypothetical protein